MDCCFPMIPKIPMWLLITPQQKRKKYNPKHIYKVPIENNKVDFELIGGIYRIDKRLNIRHPFEGFHKDFYQKTQANHDVQNVQTRKHKDKASRVS